MFRTINFEGDILQRLNHQFIHADPFSYVCIDGFLEYSIAASLSENFPSLSQMDILYHGLNENKGEHSSFKSLHVNFKNLRDELASRNFVKNIEIISGINSLQTINDRYGAGLHQEGNGSFLDIHIAYNLHPLERRQRRLNLIIFLNKNWQEEWGRLPGVLECHEYKCVTRIEPKFNRYVLFICNNISYHGYSHITCPASITRKSFYFYFFSKPEKKLIYHDTVFAPAPNDTFIHKYRVKAKEFLKNSIKQLLYYSGLNKFLK
ncbi:MAG: 2OG-Fe(II) oxygenase [Bacteroidota bacterium]|nr:2OG-Fe(II) oxygenase [Bacteroidota bacterium]